MDWRRIVISLMIAGVSLSGTANDWSLVPTARVTYGLSSLKVFLIAHAEQKGGGPWRPELAGRRNNYPLASSSCTKYDNRSNRHEAVA